MKATERVLARLKEVGFETGLGGVTPFGEKLPLVTGVAWEKHTAQIALITHSEGSVEDMAWRQLLFAGSGLRHHLSGDGPSALATPVILAIVDEDGEKQIRRLAENLAKEYAVFSRVDINLVPVKNLKDPEKLDDALAPLLPRCRSLLGKEISRQEVQKFWAELRGNVEGAAEGLDDVFTSLRSKAGRDAADALVSASAGREELPSPAPLGELGIWNFRSIKEMELKLFDVNIIHGPNGGGKTTIVEAMEFGWAGTSQKRNGAKPSEYAKHLPGNGEGDFKIEVDGRSVRGVSEHEEAELRRCVLTHEAMTRLASEEPKKRFEGLLTVTGLEIPDLDSRTKEFAKTAKQDADTALAAVGIAPLARTDSKGLEHLRGALRSNFLREFSELPDLDLVEGTLASVSGGSFTPREWPTRDLRMQLQRADAAVAELAEERGHESEILATLDDAAKAVESLLASRLEAAAAARQLLDWLRQRFESSGEQGVEPGSPEDRVEGPIRVDLAARWLNHARGLSQAADRFRDEATEIEDQDWAARLIDYAEAVDRASAVAPDVELERLSQPRQRPKAAQQSQKIDPDVLKRAAFGKPPDDPKAVEDPLQELAETLQAHGDGLRKLDQRLRNHPSRRFGAHREMIMDAICRFELARTLRRGGPILETSERMVSELLDGRLAPVVRELVGAIVRFEWYFEPLQMSAAEKEVVFGGLGTDRADLDARLVLNSAEQTVLGVAWFLGLHMLQPKERRRVLVLDDPTSGFDNANQSGFASTLRAFVRLLKPEQVVVTTHDDAIAAVLTEELSVVDDWPRSVARMRFQRDEDDFSVYSVEDCSVYKGEFDPETQQLGLPEDAPAVG